MESAPEELGGAAAAAAEEAEEAAAADSVRVAAPCDISL